MKSRTRHPGQPAGVAGPPAGKLSLRDLRRLYEQRQPIVAVTAYDWITARLVDAVGIPLILVGDSLGMTVLGYRNTIPVTLEQSLHHTAAVVRGTRSALVIGDMPFLTYQVSAEEALRNAGRYLQEAGADGVKLEGGIRVAPTIHRLVAAGIPVLGHIGIQPQSVLADGGYRVHGRTAEEAEALKADARAVQEAGAFAVVLEGLPTALAGAITRELAIPTIGIGAGPQCSGQIQVIHDLLGLFEDFVPRHARRYAQLAQAIRDALAAYREDVLAGRFPSEEQSFQ
ncbi:MAG: 3-methyl-2-oxobutanoate hydroxymethyltransferase [Lentisphaerae bacterium ADurb.BinA184]|nr:MAG: 3-methyl-2-oxobutanoate hydroxymethyltransferase [Lentisphaerae bacterium ADurb.BinA184]